MPPTIRPRNRIVLRQRHTVDLPQPEADPQALMVGTGAPNGGTILGSLGAIALEFQGGFYVSSAGGRGIRNL